MSLNPDLEYDSMYDERKRMDFSRLRLSSHRLAVETGRWSRVPADRRLCACGLVQTEYVNAASLRTSELARAVTSVVYPSSLTAETRRKFAG